MLRVALVVLLLAMALGSVRAQHSSPGAIDDPVWGLRFVPPEDWTPHQAPEGYLFVAPAQEGLLAILPHEARTVEALRAEAQQGITDAAGTLLQLQGPIEPFGDDGLAADFGGWIEGSPAQARVIGLVSPHGRGATILVATAPQHYSETYQALAEEVAQSVVFTAPPTQAAQPQPAGAEEREWQDFLQGCRLYVNDSYNSGGGSGIIDETTIDLCPGYFTFSDHSMTVFNEMDPVSGDDPYLHSDKKGAGQWSVVRQGGASVLQLRFHNGSVRSFTLGYEDGKTFLDGQRWLRSCNPNVSVGPQCL